MATTNTSLAQAPDSDSSSSIGRVFGALFSPGRTFRSIARRPTWLVPVLLITILELGVVATFSHRVGFRSLLEKQFQNNSRVQQMTAAQQQQTMQTSLKYASVVAYAEMIVGPVLVVLIAAAIYLATFNLLGGTQLKFSTSLGIVSYASTPIIISSLLGLVILFLKDPSTVDLQNLVASNPGVFLSSDSPQWLLALLRSFDVFSFWVMALLAIGYSAAAPKKLSFGKAFFYIFAVWFLVILIRVGATAAFS
ncbi:MAG: YIP1 family protein [Candidatus Acidiferrales bacterium]